MYCFNSKAKKCFKNKHFFNCFQILNLLQEGGAERSNYFSDFVTHLIAGYDALENDISAAKDIYEIPAVTQNWILYSVKCNKLLPYPNLEIYNL